MKQLNSNIDKLRETILNIGIQNTQDVNIFNVIGPEGEHFQLNTSAQSKKKLDTAKSLFEQKRYIEAIKYFQEALNYDCDNWVAAMYLGFIYLSLPDIDIDFKKLNLTNDERLFKSIQYSSLATEKDANHFNQFMNLGIAQKHLGGKGLIRLAIKNLYTAYTILSHDPAVAKNPQLFMNKAKVRSFMGEFEEAIGNKEKATQYRKEAIELFEKCPEPKPPELETWKKQAQKALNKLLQE